MPVNKSLDRAIFGLFFIFLFGRVHIQGPHFHTFNSLYIQAQFEGLPANYVAEDEVCPGSFTSNYLFLPLVTDWENSLQETYQKEIYTQSLRKKTRPIISVSNSDFPWELVEKSINKTITILKNMVKFEN